jgi:hypothetical protein
MNTKIDRSLQRDVLEILAASYGSSNPDNQGVKALSDDPQKLAANLRYLTEHGLIEGGFRPLSDGSGKWSIVPNLMHITARGLDLLEDDGGLSAVLGTVTIKLHPDTIRDLIEARLAALPIPDEERQSLIARLRKASATALQNISIRLMEQGLETMAKTALDALQRLIPD